MSIKRGEIILVNFEPTKGSEANKIRPAIVITNNKANSYAANVVVIPLTSNTDKIYPFQLFLAAKESGLNKDSKAQVELLRSVSKKRLKKPVGQIGERQLGELESRIKIHLGFS